ncbi:MAG: hypothetical protein ABI895_00485 [Deltaproteobacteria bacterium]
MATRDCGAYAAAALGMLNEIMGQNPDEERMMDNRNNQCGIYLGEESTGSCEDECRNALNTYGLQFQPYDEEYYSSDADSY